MAFWMILLLALGLGLDAFVACTNTALRKADLTMGQIMTMAVIFGTFEAFMPLVGYALGLGVADIIASLDYLVALVLFCTLGGKMFFEGWRKYSLDRRKKRRIKEKRKIDEALAEIRKVDPSYQVNEEEAERRKKNQKEMESLLIGIIKDPYAFSIRRLLVSAAATSVYAAVVGIILAAMEISVFTPVGIIAIFAIALSFFGGIVGRAQKVWPGQIAGMIGGLVLISLGLKIFINQMSQQMML